DRQRLERRDVQRVQAAGPWRASRQTTQPRLWRCRYSAALAQLNQARQKSSQRLAAAGGRDQQHRAAGARLGQELELMRARRPSALGEPARKRFGKKRVFGAIEHQYET